MCLTSTSKPIVQPPQKSIKMDRPRLAWWIAAPLVATLIGCGSGSPFDYVPARGVVRYEDGEPVPVGKVIFKSLAEPKGAAHARPGGADLDNSGSFSSVTSYKPGDGLVPGKHKVAIMFAVDDDGKPLVHPDYANMSTTPLEVDTADSPFEIVVKRP